MGSAAPAAPSVALALVRRNYFSTNLIVLTTFVAGFWPPLPVTVSMFFNRSLMVLETIFVS
jgi:hypothetical protein